MNNKTKIIGAVLGIVMFIALMAGLTYAYTVWQSDDINKVVSSKCFNVLYEGGNDISGTISPSTDYTGGKSTTIKMDMDSSCDIDAVGKIYLTTDARTSENLYTPGLLNYQVLINGELTNIRGNITSSGETIIDVGLLNRNSNPTTTYTVYVWLNGEYITNEHASSSYSGSVKSEAVQIVETPITDFIYYLGSDYPTVDNIEYYSYEYEDTFEFEINPIPLNENEVLLVQYRGSNSDVYVPSTYTIDDNEYNVIMLSGTHLTYYDEEAEIDIDDVYGVFSYNQTIEEVVMGDSIEFIYYEKGESIIDYLFQNCINLINVPSIPNGVINMNYTFYGCAKLVNAPVIPSSVTYMNGTFSGCANLVNAPVIPNGVTDMGSTFSGCTSLENAPVIPNGVTNMNSTFSDCPSLVNAPVIPNGVTNMGGTFSGCTSLENAPVIPNGVTNMGGTFSGCTSLVNAPVIPNGVTDMGGTFSGCTSLVNAPVIPNAVTNMNSTFSGCTSLVNAPVIPNGVTNMFGTFSGCTNLTGIVRINSADVRYVTNIFSGTTKQIIVQTPPGTTTYSIKQLDTTNGMPNNVTRETIKQ